MSSSPYREYQEPLEDLYDWYDIQLNDDVTSMATLTGDAGDIFILPVPYDLAPEEALVIHGTRIHLEDAALSAIVDIDNFTAYVHEILVCHWFFFRPDQVDETTLAYRDEQKQAIWTQKLQYENSSVYDGTDEAAMKSGRMVLDSVCHLKKGIVFPLNPAVKLFHTGDGLGTSLLDNPDNIRIRIYYKTTKNPLGYMGKILALMQSEIQL